MSGSGGTVEGRKATDAEPRANEARHEPRNERKKKRCWLPMWLSQLLSRQWPMSRLFPMYLVVVLVSSAPVIISILGLIFSLSSLVLPPWVIFLP